jgi:hypothetical protein
VARNFVQLRFVDGLLLLFIARLRKRRKPHTRNFIQLYRLSFTLKPFHGLLISSEESFRLCVNVGMILVQPVLFFPCQECLIDELPAIWDHRNMLKSQVWFVPELVPSLSLPYHYYVFYANAKGPVFIVTGLIRDDVTGGKGYFRVLNAGSDAYRTLMYIQI